MTKQDKLRDMLKTRNPLNTQREAVTPAKLYTSPQVDKTTSIQNHKATKPQRVKQTKPQVVKYTTHLKKETIKELKRYALDNDLKDYEVMQKAVEKFIKNK